MASYAATIDVRVTGLPSLKNLENRIGLLQQNFTKLNAAAANIAAPFAQHIQAINQMNVGLRESTRLLEQQLRLTNVIVSRSARGGGGGGGGGTNSNVLEEQRRGWQQQILQLQQRARLLTENTAITDKLRSATESLLTGTGQTVRLGLEQLKNAKALLTAAEDRAKTEALNFEHQLELIAEIEKEEEQNARNTARRIKQEQDDRNALLRQRMTALQRLERDEEKAERDKMARIRRGVGIAGKVGSSVLDAVTFGNGAAVARGAANSTIRGGLAAATVGAGAMQVGADSVLRSLPGGNMLANIGGSMGKGVAAMTGPLGVVGEALHNMLATLGHLPQALQLAAIAAFAFAPAIGGIATQAVVKGIPALGKLGKALADVTGLSKTAAPAIEGVKNVFSKGGASFMEPLTDAVSGMNMELNVTNNLVKVLGATLEENLAASKISRLASGFKEFSAGIEGAIGVEKAKRRNLDKRMRGYKPGTDAATQLMLPAFQERGLQQLSTSNINQVAGQTKTTLGQISAIIKPMTADVSAMALSMGNVKDNTLDVLGVMRQLGLAIEQLQAASSKADMLAGKSTGTRQGPIEARTKALQDFAILEKKLISEAATLRDTKDLNSYNTRQKRIKYLADLENKASEERRKVVENVALGAGFPLLFGGGAGAVLGGAAGGLYQGNPMMSVVTSAIGTLVDQFVTGVLTMGASVNDLIGNFEALKTAMVFVNKEQEHEIKLLIDSGRVQQAANEIQARLIDIVGSDGLQALSEAGRASDELSRTWGEFSLQMQAFVAGPLAAFINQINKTLGNVNQQNKYVQSIQDVNTLYMQLNKEGKTTQANQLVKNVQKAQNVSAAQFMADPATLTASVRQQIDTYKQFLSNKGQQDAKLSAEQRQKQIQNAADLYADLAAAERKHQQDKLQYANQYADMVLSLLRQQEDMDLQLARKAQDIRLQTRQKELDILEQQSRIELDAARNVATQRQLQFGPGEGIAAAVQAAVDEYNISIQEINNSAEVKQKQAKLELIRLDIENERYKFDTAKQIARLNYDNIKQIARINEQINLQNEEAARNNYDLRIGVATAELAAIRAQAISQYTMASAEISPTMPADQRRFYETMKTGMFEVLKDSATMQQKIESGALFKKPAPLGRMGSLPSMGADFTAVDKANSALKDQLQIQIDLLSKGDTANKQKAAELQLIKQLRDAAVNQLDSIIKGQLDQAAYQREYGELLQKGTLPALADQLTKIEALYKPAKDAFDLQIKMTEAAILEAKARGENVEGLERALEALKEQQGILDKRKTDATQGATDAASRRSRLEEKRNEVQGQLNELLDPVNQLVTAADAIGTAFSTSFKGIIDGSMTAREALAGFFKSVADAFLDMAAQIIAKWIALTILNSVLALFPGGKKGTTSLDNANLADVNKYSIRLDGLATGGPAMANTPYIVGEKGPELFMPGRSGTVIPNDALGGGSTNVVVNVDASGNSNVQGDQAQGKQLGLAVSAAVQAELIKQQRPGGLLASTRR